MTIIGGFGVPTPTPPRKEIPVEHEWNWKHIAIAAIAVASILGLIAAISLFNTNPAATTTSSGWQPPPEPANPGGWIPPDEPNEPATDRWVSKYLEFHPNEKIYSSQLSPGSNRLFYNVENLPSEISLTYGGSHYLVLTDFKPGGLFSGYIEYRRPTELDKTIQKQLKKYTVEFRYRSKYSFNPDGSDAIFLVPVTFNGKLKALRPGGFITQKTEWINEPTESVKLGDRFYFKSLPVKDEVLPQGYIFEYSTAAKKQTKYIEIL